MITRLVASLLLALALATPATALDISRISSNLRLAAMSDTELAAKGLRRERIGSLTLPDGRLTAADPLVMPEREPFARTVAAGTYPAEAIVLSGSDPRNVALILRFSPALPLTWELAVLPGQDISTLKEDEFFGIPVDAGTAAFMSSGYFKASEERLDQVRRQSPGSNPNYYDDVLAAEYSGATRHLRHQPLPNRPEAAAIIASSGWGDGYYPVLFGLGEDGKPVLAMIDFYVATNNSGLELPNPLTGERLNPLLDAPVLDIVTEAVKSWGLLLACTLPDKARHDSVLSAWQQERAELIWLFDDARLSAGTIRTLMASTEPKAMIAAFGSAAEREARCIADQSWRELELGTHQSDPSLEITRLLGNR